MWPTTISRHLIQAIEHHAHPSITDDDLLEKVRGACPVASLSEISRAALYITTDPFPASIAVTQRLYDFAWNLRRAG